MHLASVVAVIAALVAVVGKDSVSTQETDLVEYGADKWSHHGGTRPNVVVTPHTVEEVQRVVRLCAEWGVPLIPYGAGTSLEGHTTAPQGGCVVAQPRSTGQRFLSLPTVAPGAGVTLVMTGMDSVLRVSESDMDVSVQPGISYNTLNETLRERGLFFPVDPGPGASIGGMVATGCSGTNAVRYGTMKQNVLALKVRQWQRCAGTLFRRLRADPHLRRWCCPMAPSSAPRSGLASPPRATTSPPSSWAARARWAWWWRPRCA